MSLNNTQQYQLSDTEVIDFSRKLLRAKEAGFKYEPIETALDYSIDPSHNQLLRLAYNKGKLKADRHGTVLVFIIIGGIVLCLNMLL